MSAVGMLLFFLFFFGCLLAFYSQFGSVWERLFGDLLGFTYLVPDCLDYLINF